jgi:hypothetical protein
MTQCTASEANAIPLTLLRESLGSMTQLSKLCHFDLGSGPCAYGEVRLFAPTVRSVYGEVWPRARSVRSVRVWRGLGLGR